MNLSALQEHADRLCRKHDIVWHDDLKPGRAWAVREFEEILTPPIRGPVSYAVVLHEIGHILGRHQNSNRTIVRETWAWRWARAHALLWTPAMERAAVSALAWYAARSHRPNRNQRRAGAGR